MMRELPYSVLDVFAERPLEGNPLCVFHNGQGLETEEMQALARETNLSETTFVLPSDDPELDRGEGVRVRIFTTTEELPFAGHPTLGTAAWLRQNHPTWLGAEAVTLRLNVGPIPVRFSEETPLAAGSRAAQAEEAAATGLYGSMRQRDPEFGGEYTPEEIAAVLGLAPEELLPGYKPQTVSTGNPFLIVALRSLEVLARLHIPQERAVPWLRARGARWFYCIAPAVETGTWRARMQWESGEDPATGSAAGPCIAWLVRVGLAPSGVPQTLWQGVEMARRSRLTATAERGPEGVMGVHVAGRTIPVARGHFFLPR